MYKRARYYDQTDGEFLSPDPLEFNEGLSNYVLADPFMGIRRRNLHVVKYTPSLPRRNLSASAVADPIGPVVGKICAVGFWEKGKPPSIYTQGEAGRTGGEVLPGGAKTLQQILDWVRKNKCCTLYTLSHQGTDALNPGGAIIQPNPKFPNTPVVVFGDNNDIPKRPRQFEIDLGKLFKEIGCGWCAINIYACGGTSAQHKASRQKTADNTGCIVCGSIKKVNPTPSDSECCTLTRRDGFSSPAGKKGPVGADGEQGFIIRPYWQYDCAFPKSGGQWTDFGVSADPQMLPGPPTPISWR